MFGCVFARARVRVRARVRARARARARARVAALTTGTGAGAGRLVDNSYHDDKMDLIDATNTILALHLTASDGNKAGHKKGADNDHNINAINPVTKKRVHGGEWNHGRTDNGHFFTKAPWGEGGPAYSLRSSWLTKTARRCESEVTLAGAGRRGGGQAFAHVYYTRHFILAWDCVSYPKLHRFLWKPPLERTREGERHR
jgi:hypothetical protein